MITPDDKDWTWVLGRPCPDCGFDAEVLDRATAPAVLRDSAARWREVLAAFGATDRPDDRTWSPLEYACHTRDVFRLFH